MLQRNLLYTGITRCKGLVVVVGQKKAVAMAVRNSRGRRRWSKLREFCCRRGDETNARLAVLVEEAAAGLEVPVIAHR